MWNLVLSDIKYYKQYYIAITVISSIVLMMLVFESKGVFKLNIPDKLVPTISVLVFLSSFIFMVIFYNQKELRERITVILPISFKDRKRSKYLIYLTGVVINVILLLVGVLFFGSHNFTAYLSEAFSRSMILAGGTFIVIEFLQIKAFRNKLVNVIAGAIIIMTVFCVNIALQKYFVPSFENHILIAENILAVTWAILLMFIAGFCFTKRVSFLDNN